MINRIFWLLIIITISWWVYLSVAVVSDFVWKKRIKNAAFEGESLRTLQQLLFFSLSLRPVVVSSSLTKR